MKVLLTGATGFIGHAVALRLLALDHDIVVLTRDPAKARARCAFPCELIAWEPTQGPPDAAVFAGADAVINLAGESLAERRWSAAQKTRILESRRLATRYLVEGMRRRRGKPITFVSSSAIGFYGDRGNEELHESSSAGDGFLAEVCREWEREAKGLPYGEGRVVILRFGMVLGGGGGALRKLVPIFKSGTGGPVGSGEQWVSWIHLDDAAELVVKALENPALEGPVNAVSPHPVTNAELSRLLSQQLGVPVFLRAPAAAVRALMGEMAEVVLSSQRVVPDKPVGSGFSYRFPRLEDALADLLPAGAADEVSMESWVPSPVDKVFSFFCDEKNLEKLMPPALDFRVTGKSTATMTEGTLIDFRFRMKGIPFKWKARIDSWEPNRSFVDTQIEGPFSIWRHTHTFVPAKGGTLLRDRVQYSVPGGAVGRGLLGGTARKDVEATFRHRHQQLEKELTPSRS